MSTNTPASKVKSIKNDLTREDGRSAPLGTPTQRKLTGIRRRTELAYLLVLQYQAKLSPGQWAYLQNLQRRVSLEELESAVVLFGKLLASARSLARAQKELQRTQERTPLLNSKFIQREKRRIGVGYRDKGTLRLPHEDHSVTPRSWWWEDISLLFHLSSDWMFPEDLLAEEDLAQGNLLESLGNIVRATGMSALLCTLDPWHDPESPSSSLEDLGP
jgi:hypothetical protein